MAMTVQALLATGMTNEPVFKSAQKPQLAVIEGASVPQENNRFAGVFGLKEWMAVVGMDGMEKERVLNAFLECEGLETEAKRLMFARKRRGLTVNQVARRSGLGCNYYRNLERGQVRLGAMAGKRAKNLARRLSKALDVSLNYIWGLSFTLKGDLSDQFAKRVMLDSQEWARLSEEDQATIAMLVPKDIRKMSLNEFLLGVAECPHLRHDHKKFFFEAARDAGILKGGADQWGDFLV